MKEVKKLEDEIRRVLTDKRISALKSSLEKEHTIDCIFLLYLDKSRWKDALSFMRNLQLPLSYRALTSRLMELEKLGLAKRIHIDSYRKYYAKTDSGKKMAKLLLRFFQKVDAVVEE